MDKTEKKPYEAPLLTVVTFKAERGYATSGLRKLALSLASSEYGSASLEDRTDGGSWGNGGWF